MKRTTVLISLGLVFFAAQPSEAGDWNNGAGQLKSHGGLAGVPVPAPVPYAESFSWYVRADLGYALASSGSATSTNGFGIIHSESYGDTSGPFHGGIGIGRYMTPTLRMDLTGDYRAFQKSLKSQSTYTATTVTPNAAGTGTQTNTFSGTRNEEMRTANHTILFNVYHDFNRGSGFNPYVGAGLGASIREAKAQFNDQAPCTAVDNTTGLPTACTPYSKTGGEPRDSHFGLAAALMAGATYEMMPGVLIDGGYRMTWEGGNSTLKINGDTFTAGARLDHEIRAGVRWNVW